MIRWALVLAAGWLAAGPASADTPQVDRSMGKEPVYQTKAPKYGLLVCGPEGKDRVWLVRDGDTLFVDRNGNGDLTEPGEKIAAEKRPGQDPEEEGYSFDVGDLTVGGRTHKGLQMYVIRLKQYADSSLGKRPDVKAALEKDPQAAAVGIKVDVEVPGIQGGGSGGRVAFLAGPIDLTGVFQLTDTPAEAPVVHLGGPLQITFYLERPTLRVGRGGEFILVVGTPGVGPGTFAMVVYQDTIPEDAKPVAEFSLPAARSGDPPIQEKVTITDRC
ncbi:MAG: hypothetical protein L0Z62_35565 [Gemmataceae bacterium]|nr:hypothetical protein [Gemmataceae bacterium]